MPKITLLLFVVFVHFCQSVLAAEPDRTVFVGKVAVAPKVFVSAETQFSAPLVIKPALGSRYSAEAFERTRVGTILLSPTISIHVDTIENKIHGVSYFELLNAKTGALLGQYENQYIGDPE